jgi:hypothetical protein
VPLFKEKKQTPGGLGAKKGPDLYSSARRIQTVSRGWWNSPSMRRARKNFWSKFFRKVERGGQFMWDGE